MQNYQNMSKSYTPYDETVKAYESIINLIAKFVNNSTVFESRVSVSSGGIILDSIDITLDSDFLTIGPGSCSIDILGETTVDSYLAVHGNQLTDLDYNKTSYTSFSGNVISSGSVVVTKKLGVCYISGTLALSKSISAWTTILSSSKVPAPQHGELVPFEASQWGTSYARPLRGKVTPDGGLQLIYGVAGSYVINISYPIE